MIWPIWVHGKNCCSKSHKDVAWDILAPSSTRPCVPEFLPLPFQVEIKSILSVVLLVVILENPDLKNNPMTYISWKPYQRRRLPARIECIEWSREDEIVKK